MSVKSRVQWDTVSEQKEIEMWVDTYVGGVQWKMMTRNLKEAMATNQLLEEHLNIDASHQCQTPHSLTE